MSKEGRELTTEELFELTTEWIGHCDNIEQLSYIERFTQTRIKFLSSSMPVSVVGLQLGVRTENALLNAGITETRVLFSMRPSQLLRLKNFGRRSLNEVTSSANRWGIDIIKNIDHVL